MKYKRPGASCITLSGYLKLRKLLRYIDVGMHYLRASHMVLKPQSIAISYQPQTSQQLYDGVPCKMTHFCQFPCRSISDSSGKRILSAKNLHFRNAKKVLFNPLRCELSECFHASRSKFLVTIRKQIPSLLKYKRNFANSS